MDLVAVGLDEMSAAQVEKLHAEFGATPEQLKQDAESLREWIVKQPHLPNLTGMPHISAVFLFLSQSAPAFVSLEQKGALCGGHDWTGLTG